MSEQLPFRFSNAAGWPKTPEGVSRLVRCHLSTHVEFGSFTVKKREERGGGTDFDVLDNGTASNNRSLPNGGLTYLLAEGPRMVEIIHVAGKKAVLNGAPFSLIDERLLAEAALAIGVDEYVSNRSCPNTEGSIICYDHHAMWQHDLVLNEVLARRIPWWRKVGPYVNPKDRETQASQTVQSMAVGLIACNTLPGVRLRREGKPIITATGTNGLGGMSGEYFRPFAQANAEDFCELLQGTGKHVIGAGGISSGLHVEEYLQLGCCGVQVGAALFKNEDPGILQEIGELWAMNYAPAA